MPPVAGPPTSITDTAMSIESLQYGSVPTRDNYIQLAQVIPNPRLDTGKPLIPEVPVLRTIPRQPELRKAPKQRSRITCPGGNLGVISDLDLVEAATVGGVAVGADIGGLWGGVAGGVIGLGIGNVDLIGRSGCP